MNENIYQEKGYTSRLNYLDLLAAEYNVDRASVMALATLLGPSEDFDGLVEELEDFSQFI